MPARVAEKKKDELLSKVQVAVRDAVVVVACQADRDAAVEYLSRVVKPLISYAIELFRKPKKLMDEAKAALLESERAATGPLKDIEQKVKKAIGEYDDRVEQAARRAMLQAQEAMRAENASRAGDRMLEGDFAGASILLAGSHEITIPAVAAPSSKNSSSTKVWKFEMVDQKKVKAEFMTPDTKMIGKLVAELGESAANLVGAGSIRVYSDRQISITTAKE